MNYYTPSSEKLSALGFVPGPRNQEATGFRWARQGPRGNTQSIWIGAGPLALGVETGGEMLLDLDVRLRSEAEFDLLLWQIGWTDKEPAQ